MQNGFKKGLKPYIVRYLGILMGICYILNPLHQQINTVFHKISHGLDMPNFVIPHANQSSYNKEHGSHHHLTEKGLHDHVFLDLVNSLFKTSNEENNSPDSFMFTIKMDKHLLSQWNIESKIIVVTPNNNFNNSSKNTLKGFFTKSVKPPLNNMGHRS
tara:strand:+ start:959 stop:1432 length:474 start_codon:yes stop_codon:yes gene_type:complete